ncbi:APC family permease [Pseudoflavonifractor phocaeensis]|uniref:APC family permease n=1 Tax=Pseudoflavonifractor phocaeensis TaxID=1870988 RepID=UPI00308EE711|nr:amino acid permease [Oscillospiraceae bacterium]
MASNPSKKNLRFGDCFFMGVGQTIGAGVITMTGIAIAKTGSGVFWAYILAAVCIFICKFPSLIMGTTIPRTSASYAYSNLFSPKFGAFYIGVSTIARVTMAFFGFSFATYFCSLINVNPTVVGVTIITIVFVMNLFGIKNAAKMQNIMTTILLVALSTFVIFGLPKVDFASITRPEVMFPHGANGIVDAMSLVIFAISGGFTLLEYAGSMDKPQRILPKAIFWSTLVAAFFFAVVGLVGSGVLPISEVAGKPLTVAAHTVYDGNPLFYNFFIIGGALLAIMTTMNSCFVLYYSAAIQACVDGWLPHGLAKKNKYGVPHRLCILFWLMGIIPILLNVDGQTLSRLSSGLVLFTMMIPNLTPILLPKLFPDQWKASRFYMSTPKLMALTIVSNALMLFFIVKNALGLPKNVLIIILICLAVVLLYILIFGNKIIEKNNLREKTAEFLRKADEETRANLEG